MANTYNSSVLTLTSRPTPDPFVVISGGQYYLTFTSGNKIEIWVSSSLSGFKNAEQHVVWRPPPNTAYSADLWAPELHSLNERWYIYFAAAHPSHGNASHRMYVLGGPLSSQSPIFSSWEFLGPVKNLPDQWAIDGTIFSFPSRPKETYFVYSGWPYGDTSDRCQALFITRLLGPTNAIEATSEHPRPIMISKPTNPWEISDGDHGVNEGPQFLSAPRGTAGGGWCGIVYSCAGSWTRDYKMGVLHYVSGGDPLSELAWRKDERPIVQSGGDETGGPYGPGHGSFLQLGGEGGEVVCVFHATDGPADGWERRRARCQRVIFGAEGPSMGGQVGKVTEDVEVFAGKARNGQGHGHGHGEGQPQGQGHGHGLRGRLHGLLKEL